MSILGRTSGRLNKTNIQNFISGRSFNQPKLCPSATWNPNATTFVNGIAFNAEPMGIFVNKNNDVYVTVTNLHQVQIFFNGNTTASTSISSGLQLPQGIFVTNNGDIYIDNGYSNGRVEKWTLNATSGITVMNVNGSCYSLFIDTNDTLYCSLGTQNKVMKLSLNSGATTPQVAAGNGMSGNGPDKLLNPRGIFVDLNFNLYVADCGNNRIQVFRSGQLNATTIAGSDAPITIILNCPTGIMLDSKGYVYIVDSYKHRIIRSNLNGYQCIVGCSDNAGNLANQLHNPYGFAFDTSGNIFVTDQLNERIQKFLLATNDCSKCLFLFLRKS